MPVHSCLFLVKTWAADPLYVQGQAEGEGGAAGLETIMVARACEVPDA